MARSAQRLRGVVWLALLLAPCTGALASCAGAAVTGTGDASSEPPEPAALVSGGSTTVGVELGDGAELEHWEEGLPIRLVLELRPALAEGPPVGVELYLSLTEVGPEITREDPEYLGSAAFGHLPSTGAERFVFRIDDRLEGWGGTDGLVALQLTLRATPLHPDHSGSKESVVESPSAVLAYVEVAQLFIGTLP